MRDVNDFTPLPSMYEQNAKKYGYQYFGQGETINIEQYSCPYCGASDRERLYALYMENHAHSKEPRGCRRLNLVHFAPEPAFSRYLRDSGKYVCRSADIAISDVDDQIDLTNMTIYSDKTFDIFVCSHVLEHVEDDRKALSELYRILVPGGWGILMAPIMPALSKTLEDPTATTEEERWRLFGQGDHLRLYSKHDFVKRITGAGFQVEQLNADFFGMKTFRQAGITDQSVLYIARKPN